MAKQPIPKELYKSQAERVIARFGNARKLAEILERIGKPRDPATIYKWTYDRARGGTGGLIPTSAWPDLMAAARFEGLVFKPEDMDPRPRVPDDAPVGKGFKAGDMNG